MALHDETRLRPPRQFAQPRSLHSLDCPKVLNKSLNTIEQPYISYSFTAPSTESTRRIPFRHLATIHRRQLHILRYLLLLTPLRLRLHMYLRMWMWMRMRIRRRLRLHIAPLSIPIHRSRPLATVMIRILDDEVPCIYTPTISTAFTPTTSSELMLGM
jgi:hypothetical protein